MIISPDNPDPPHLEPDVSIFGSPRDRLAFYRREIHHEISNLSGRTNTFLTAQSFLVIAYASSMGNTNPDWGPLFTLVVPALLALAVRWLLDGAGRLCPDHPAGLMPLGVSPGSVYY
ncbi:hypothetical protein SAMN05216578_10432 [Halopseudomonas formosensis]|uniref:Uncharacterized protein n=1 Tax=Halopseudomonas formosensis TaxID=1002526 RepID=A0A1I6BGS9_9GAMM|nr:hypothetical protein SAMN05216578_10432 [Halopseudomonas formosensis]